MSALFIGYSLKYYGKQCRYLENTITLSKVNWKCSKTYLFLFSLRERTDFVISRCSSITICKRTKEFNFLCASLIWS